MLSAALATKLFASPLLIGLASLAGKRWGPGAAGLLGGLPLVAAPIVVVLWLAGGADLALRAITTAPIGVWATMSYLLVFGFASRRFRWWTCLALGWACYLAVAATLHYSRLDQQHWLGIAVVPALLAAALWVLPMPMLPPGAVRLPKRELVARMLAAMALVSLLSTAAAWIGPEFTGVLAGAPVAATVIPCFTLALAGRDPMLRALRGFLAGQMGFAVFFLVLAALLPMLSTLAFVPATCAAIATSFVGVRLVQRHAFKAAALPS